jgi:hypothetical protein
MEVRMELSDRRHARTLVSVVGEDHFGDGEVRLLRVEILLQTPSVHAANQIDCIALMGGNTGPIGGREENERYGSGEEEKNSPPARSRYPRPASRQG